MSGWLTRCISCQAFISADMQDEDGYHCRSCGDEVSNADMEANGWEYSHVETMWVRYDDEDTKDSSDGDEESGGDE